jgi:hypothetical protein
MKIIVASEVVNSKRKEVRSMATAKKPAAKKATTKKAAKPAAKKTAAKKK